MRYFPLFRSLQLQHMLRILPQLLPDRLVRLLLEQLRFSDYIVDGFKVNPSAPIVLKGRRDLTLDVYRKVVWNHTPVSVDPAALKQIDAWRKEFLDFLAVHPELNVYGVNIKPGDAHKQRLTEEELKQNLLKASTPVSLSVNLFQTVLFAASFLHVHQACSEATPLLPPRSPVIS